MSDTIARESIKDTKARESIKDDVRKSLFVEAGAGSGKTTALVSRMVNMVKKGYPIEKICAITFTKAAANEFFSRFQKELFNESCKASEEKRDVLNRALKNIDLCFMGTIDSFCQMIISEYPVEAKVPYNSSIVDEVTFRKHLRSFLREVKSNRIKHPAVDLKEKWKVFINVFYDAEDIFLNSVIAFLDARNANFEDVKEGCTLGDLKNSFNNAFYVPLRDLIESNDLEFRNNERETVKQVVDSLNKEWTPERTNDIYWNLKTLKDLRISAQELEKHQELSDKFKRQHLGYCSFEYEYILGGIEKELNSHLFLIAYDFIKNAADIIPDYFRKKGILRFYDNLLYLRDMLKEDASNNDGKLIKHIREKYEYYLIDEFQDTNPLQAEIFFYLASTDESLNADWKKCIPRGGALFIVGDPKQSIYRFRNADITSYKKVKDLFNKPDCDMAVLQLTRNFRSKKVLIDWFNKTFLNIFPMDGNTENSGIFSEIPTDNNQEEDDNTVLQGVYKYDCTDEFDSVSNIISSLVGSVLIEVKEDDSHIKRKLKYSDIMVITKDKKKLKNYMSSFNSSNIPFVVEGDVPFSECPSLLTLQRLLEAVADSNNQKASFAVEKLTKCIPDFSLFREYAEKNRNKSAVVLAIDIIEEFRLLEREGDANKECLYYALELLRKEKITDIYEASQYLRSLISADSDHEKIERCLQLERSIDAVKIANLHKVKGLEAPVVILTKYGRSSNDGSPLLIDYSYDSPKAFPLRISKRRGGNSNPSVYECSSFSDKKEVSGNHNKSEQDRLKYVAATRAMNCLIIADGWNLKVENNIKDVLSRINSSEDEMRNERNVNTGDLSEEKKSILSRVCESKVKTYATRKPSNLDPEKLEKSVDEVEMPEVSDAALKGTMVHRLMEVIVSSIKNDTWDIDAIAKSIVKENGIDPENAKFNNYVSMLNEIGYKIVHGGFNQKNGVENDVIATLKNATETHSEVPFYYYRECSGTEKELINGVIDLVYRNNDGWHILDWKTNTIAENLDEKYESQLNLYKEAFSNITGEKAKDAKIYHIVLPEHMRNNCKDDA